MREIEDRLKISEQIYQSEMRFTPVVNQIYHLYEKDDHFTMSLIAPTEWGRSKKMMKHVATVRLLGDHSWQVISSTTPTDK